VESVTLLVPGGAAESVYKSGLDEGVIIAESQNFARGLINEPGNVLTPTEFGRRAAAMAKEVGLACEVHSTDKMKELKMGAFLGVAQGSAEPPALIVLRYEPADAPKDGPVLGLVGKGITFDTGGISIKPSDNMEKMKYDMAGGAAMIGAMRAIAQLKPKVRVIAVILATENMPGGKAYKPGDVLTAMSGKTIEIINTDAEGRLVLADGLHYAQQLGATRQINAGVFTNSDDEYAHFAKATEQSGERFWRLPLEDEYRESIVSQIGDIKNTGGRYGGSITAAMFLKEFVGDTPWLHLDIASTAWNDDAKAWIASGPTGIAVRTITEWVRSYA
jgi:leucyl aminopeptidase